VSITTEDPRPLGGAPPVVARSISERVGEIGRPTGTVPVAKDLAHLPGEGGLWAGLANVASLQRHGSAHLLTQVRRYGPVFRHALAFHPLVFVADPSLIGGIARNEDGAWSSSLAYQVLFGGLDASSSTLDSLVGLDFGHHKEARRLLQPAFTPAALAGYLEIALPIFEKTVTEWVDAGRVAFKPAIRSLFTQVASNIFMGALGPEETTVLDKALKDVWEAPFGVIKHPVFGPKWRRGMAGFRTLREALRAQVEARRSGNGTDLFSRLCQTGRDHVDWLDDDTLVRLFIGVMAGAFETTSLGVTSMAHLLAQHQDWQDRIRQESFDVGPGGLSFEATKQLEVSERCWKETLRLFPVAVMFPRRSLRDLELAGHRIPAGAQIMCLTAAALMDPKWWNAPERFDPERFSPTRAEDRRHRSAFLPFGAGAHTCIGLQLANLKAKAFWHTLLSKCRIRLVDGGPVRHEANPFGVVSGDVRLDFEKVSRPEGR
jgi:cytochrome P450